MISVMVVDDSPLVRKVVTDILTAEPDISVCATAASGELALRKLQKVRPDVVTMDLDMPGMGGVRAIAEIMRTRPTPVIVLSALARRGAEQTIRALESGAVDFITKPTASLSGNVQEVAEELLEKVRQASRVDAGKLDGAAREPRPAPATVIAPEPVTAAGPVEIVAIGASTGGPVALKTVLCSLPGDFPAGIAVVQHMPPLFTGAFASRLDGLCALSVKEASDGDELLPGSVLIAPGDRHMTVTRTEGYPRVTLSDGPPVGGHRPSVDVLMESVARGFGERAVAVVLTGMGKDGARGAARVREKGGWVIAQDAATSVVFGMNGEVVRNGVAHQELPVSGIAAAIRERVAAA